MSEQDLLTNRWGLTLLMYADPPIEYQGITVWLIIACKRPQWRLLHVTTGYYFMFTKYKSIIHANMPLGELTASVGSPFLSKWKYCWGRKCGHANLLAFSEYRWCGILESLQRSALWSFCPCGQRLIYLAESAIILAHLPVLLTCADRWENRDHGVLYNKIHMKMMVTSLVSS